MHGSGYSLKKNKVGRQVGNFFIPPALMPRGKYFVRSLFCYVTKITSKFCVKVSQMGISQQPLIKKHSYLGHAYLRGSAYIP